MQPQPTGCEAPEKECEVPGDCKSDGTKICSDTCEWSTEGQGEACYCDNDAWVECESDEKCDNYECKEEQVIECEADECPRDEYPKGSITGKDCYSDGWEEIGNYKCNDGDWEIITAECDDDNPCDDDQTCVNGECVGEATPGERKIEFVEGYNFFTVGAVVTQEEIEDAGCELQDFGKGNYRWKGEGWSSDIADENRIYTVEDGLYSSTYRRFAQKLVDETEANWGCYFIRVLNEEGCEVTVEDEVLLSEITIPEGYKCFGKN